MRHSASADPEGGGGGGGQGVRIPLENHKLYGFLKGISKKKSFFCQIDLDPPPPLTKIPGSAHAVSLTHLGHCL